MSAPRRHPPRFLFSEDSDARESRMLRSLHDAYPSSLTSQQLMHRCGLSWRTEPVSAFASLCISFGALNRALASTGWEVLRSGVTPNAEFKLNPSRGGN